MADDGTKIITAVVGVGCAGFLLLAALTAVPMIISVRSMQAELVVDNTPPVPRATKMQPPPLPEPRPAAVAPAAASGPIDGVLGEGEWAGAQRFDVGPDHGSMSGATVWVATVGSDLRFAVAVPETSPSKKDKVEIRLDGDNDDQLSLGDDMLQVTASGKFIDGHYGPKGYTGRETAQDGAGAVGTTATQRVFELTHPLASGQPNDVQLRAGATLGLCVRYYADGAASAWPAECEQTRHGQSRYQDVVLRAM